VKNKKTQEEFAAKIVRTNDEEIILAVNFKYYKNSKFYKVHKEFELSKKADHPNICRV